VNEEALAQSGAVTPRKGTADINRFFIKQSDATLYKNTVNPS